MDYPIWQQTIRAAQAQQQALLEKQRAIEEAREAAYQAGLGQQLTEALRYFGIHIAQPKANSYEENGYTFSLLYLSKFGSKGKPRLECEDGLVSFHLSVCREDPDARYEEDRQICESVRVTDWPVTGDWRDFQVRLADALDDVDGRLRRIQETRQAGEQYAQQQQQQQDTLETRVANAIRDLIREELHHQY